MYKLYLLGFKTLHAIGLKTTAVRLARYLEAQVTHVDDHIDLTDAIWTFYGTQQSFPTCNRPDGCYEPILSDDDPAHTHCRELEAEEAALIKAEEDAAWEAFQLEEQRKADEHHYARLMASFCTETGCFEEGIDVYYSKCAAHDTTCMFCGYDPCVFPDDEDGHDDGRDDEECPGGCGQPAYACVCAEIKSLARHNADPATRGSWWVA